MGARLLLRFGSRKGDFDAGICDHASLSIALYVIFCYNNKIHLYTNFRELHKKIK
jgi:hypothetical protein